MSRWTLTSLSSELSLLVNGESIRADEVVRRYSGRSFTLQCGRHFLVMKAEGTDGVHVSANGAPGSTLRGTLSARITRTGFACGPSDASGALAPWPSPAEPQRAIVPAPAWATELLGTKLVVGGSTRPTTAVMAGRAERLVGLLFCAGWSAPSCALVERLKRCCAHGLAQDMAIVAVVLADSKAEYESVCATFQAALPEGWATVPYEACERVFSALRVRGVPSLIVYSMASGEVVRANATVDVMAHSHEPSAVLKLCGIDRPTEWQQQRARAHAARRLADRGVELSPEALVDAFRAADRDGSGSVSLSELVLAFKALELPVTAASLRLFREQDKDVSLDSLDFAEFVALCSRCRRLFQPRDGPARRLLLTFEEFDSDASGLLTPAQAVAALARLGVRATEDVVLALHRRRGAAAEADDLDGELIDFPEFADLHGEFLDPSKHAQPAGAQPQLQGSATGQPAASVVARPPAEAPRALPGASGRVTAADAELRTGDPKSASMAALSADAPTPRPVALTPATAASAAATPRAGADALIPSALLTTATDG